MAPAPQLNLDQQRALAKARARAKIASGGNAPSRAFAPDTGIKSESGFPANPMMASASVQQHKPQFRLPTLEQVGDDIGKGLMTTPQRVERGIVGAAEGAANLPRDVAETFSVPYAMAGNPEVSAMFSEAGMTGDPATGPERFSKIYNDGGYAEQQQKLRAGPRFDFSAAKLPIAPEDESISGNIMEGLVQFLAARAPMGKARGIGTEVAKSAAATGTAFAGHQGRVADLIDPNAVPEGPLREAVNFLRTQPEDSPLVGRFKNMLEDAGFNLTAMGLFKAGAKVAEPVITGTKALANGLTAPRPSGPTVTAVPPTAQPGAASAGQQPPVTPAAGGAGQSGGVLNAVPAAPVATKGQRRVARDTALILGRIMRSSRIKDADIRGYLPGAIQRFKGLNDSRVPFAFFLEGDLPKHFPEPVAADIVTKLRGFGRERNAAMGPQDTSRQTTQQTIKELRGSQKDFLTQEVRDNTFKGSLVSAEDQIRAKIKQNQKTGYQSALEDARQSLGWQKDQDGNWASTGPVTASKDAQAAVAELREVLAKEGFQRDVPRSLRYEAMNEGIDIDTLLQRDPVEAAHWIQSMLGKAQRATSDAGEEALYGSMRRILLDRLERAVPGYKGARKRHGDLFATEEAVTFGDDLSKVAKNERLRTKKAREFSALSNRQKTVAVKSMRDYVLNYVRASTPEDAAAKITALQQEGFLDAIEEIMGKRGKAIADAIRKIKGENDQLRAIDQASGSPTYANLAGADAAREVVQSPVNKAVGQFGDKTSWPMTVAGDVALATAGLPPVLTVGKATTALVDRFGNPSNKMLSRATEGLYGLPPKSGNGLLSSTALTPPKPKRPRSQKEKLPPPKSPEAEILRLRQQLDTLDQRANPGEADRIVKRIEELQRGTSPAPIHKAGFGMGGGKSEGPPPIDYDGLGPAVAAYRAQRVPDAMIAERLGITPDQVKQVMGELPRPKSAGMLPTLSDEAFVKRPALTGALAANLAPHPADVNQDGKVDWQDIAITSLIGAGGGKALSKILPKVAPKAPDTRAPTQASMGGPPRGGEIPKRERVTPDGQYEIVTHLGRNYLIPIPKAEQAARAAESGVTLIVDDPSIGLRDGWIKPRLGGRKYELQLDVEGTNTAQPKEGYQSVDVGDVTYSWEAFNDPRYNDAVRKHILDGKSRAAKSGVSKPPPAQASFGSPPKPPSGGKGENGLKSPPKKAKGPVMAPRVIAELERASKTLPAEVRGSIAKNAALPPAVRVSAAEASGDDPSIYSVAAPFQRGKKPLLGPPKANAVETGIREGMNRLDRRAGPPPPLEQVADVASRTERERRAAASEAQRTANKLNPYHHEAAGIPDKPLPKSIAAKEQRTTETAIAARKALAAANLEAASQTEAAAWVAKRKAEIADALLGQGAAPKRPGETSAGVRPGIAGPPAKPRRMKPASRQEAQDMADLLFDKENAALLDDVLSGRVVPRSRSDHHFALLVAAAGSAAGIGLPLMYMDARNGAEGRAGEARKVMPDINLPDRSYREDPVKNSSTYQLVYQMQSQLRDLGAPLRPDGVMLRKDGKDTDTQSVLRQLQEANGLPVTGLLDDATIELVGELHRQMVAEKAARQRSNQSSRRGSNGLQSPSMQPSQ